MRVKQTTSDLQTCTDTLRNRASVFSGRKIIFLLASVLFFVLADNKLGFGQSICQTPTKLANFGLEGQQRTPFATDPDLYPSAIFAFTDDDWFADTAGTGIGLGVIDMTSATGRMWYACPGQGTVAMSALGFRQVMLAAASGGPVDRNKTFEARMSLPPGTIINHIIWKDAIAARDNIAAGPAKDSSVYTLGAKNMDNTHDWVPTISGTQPKNDLMDVGADLRADSTQIVCDTINGVPTNCRPDVTVTFFMTTLSSSGDAHDDVEFFKIPPTMCPGQPTTGGGPDNGHTAWTFNSNGTILKSGDLIVSTDFQQGGTNPQDSVRIWYNEAALLTQFGSYAAFNALPASPFNFAGVYNQNSSGAPFGYGVITPKGSAGCLAFAATNIDPTAIKAAPWGNFFGSQADFDDSIEQYQLVEGGLDLSRYGLDLAGTADSCQQIFGAVLFKTRSSGSGFPSALADYVGPFNFGSVVTAQATVDVPDTINCNQTTVTLHGTVTPTTAAFQWVVSNGGHIVSGANTLNPVVDHVGTYCLRDSLPPDFPNCKAQACAVVIANTTPPTVNCGGTNAACAGSNSGSACVTATGGVSPYTYAWTNGGTTSCISSLSSGTYTVTVTGANGCTNTCSYTVVSSPGVTVNCSNTPVSCNGGTNGTATVSASGGTSPFSYNWSNGGTSSTITGLAAGSYCVTVTDVNNCTNSCCTTLTQPTAVSAVCSGTPVACNGGNNGSASVTASGGTPGYTYSWSNGGNTSSISTLVAGTYTVTVSDSHNCTATCSFTVTQPTAVSANCSGTPVACNGGNNGSASVTASGGTPGYTYSWSNGGNTSSISTLVAGTYTVTVSDSHNCTATCSFTVTQPTAVSAVCGGTPVACNGGNNGSASVTASGGTPGYTYSWSNGGNTSSISTLVAGTYTVTVSDSHNCTATCSFTVTQPTAVSAVCGGTPVACNGGNNGSASVTASGGTPGYTYSWSNGGNTSTISTLVAGTYTVTVSDTHNCTATCSFTVTQPTAVSAVCGGTPVACNGGNNGSASVTASGGTPGYTYSWSNGGNTSTITTLVAGTYTVTVSDTHNCTATCSFTVTQPTAVSANCSAVPVSCNGGNNGSVSVTASGGTPGYTYSWSNGGNTSTITNLTAGTYSVTVTDTHNCTATCSATVTQPTAVSAVCGGTPVACNGGNNGSASVTASGGTPGYTYHWSNGGNTSTISTLVAGTYSVTVSDTHNCTATCSFTVTEPTAVSASCSGTPVTCNGGNNGSASVTASGGTPGYTYSWSNGGNTSSISTLVAGTYTVTVFDSHNCTATCSFTVTQPTAVSAVCGDQPVSCNGGNNGSAQVTASGGTPGYTYLWNNGGNTSSISNLTAGTYRVTVTDSHNCTATCQFTVTQPPVLSANCGDQPVSCNGGNNGSAQVTASGGTAPYSYHWNNGGATSSISGLTAGTYCVTVSDSHNCTASCCFTVTQPTALSAVCGDRPVSCNGGNNGSASVTASGGTTPYSYHWSNGGNTSTINNLVAGTYTVTVNDAHNCTATCNFTVTQPTALTCSLSCPGTLPSCNSTGNTLSVSAGGGTGALTYAWGISSTSNDWAITAGGSTSTITYTTGLGGSGTFRVTVTDANGCTTVCSSTCSCQPPVWGCTLGFWKNHTSIWNSASQPIPTCVAAAISLAGYSGNGTSSSSFAATFGLTGAQMSAVGLSPTLTLLQALNLGGGHCYNVARQGVAALLNSCGLNGNYIYNSAQVLTMVHNAIATNTCDPLGALLDHANEAPLDMCPAAGPANHRLTGGGIANESTVITAYPNPFTSQATIQFTFEENTSNVTVELFSLSGQKVAGLYNGNAEAGHTYEVTVNGNDLSQGIYIYKVTTPEKSYYEKLILVK